MKTTIKKTTEVEVDIQLPYYFKNICHAFAIIDEKTAICICYGLEEHQSIQNYSSMIEQALGNSMKIDSIEITAVDFKDIYHNVITELNNKIWL